MRFVSVRGASPAVNFRETLFRGLAPDGGLYVPEHIPKLDPALLSRLKSFSLPDIGYQVASQYIDAIPSADLRSLVDKALSFPIPLVNLEDNLFVLELFHGPTLAFKDVGARCMAEMLSYFLRQQNQTVSVLVATSGDTGSAVAHGFYGVPNVNVYILYPSGKISRLQEQQMASLEGNIHAVEVDGTFDDCQRLVKESFADMEIVAKHTLTTANSINLGRLLPQISYYFWGLAQLQRQRPNLHEAPIFVVPSGNLGNLTAALYAKWMGAPMGRLAAGTNVNDVLPTYLSSGSFIPRTSIQTISNAMDVGNPSNLARIQALYKNDVERMRNDVEAISITDAETLQEIDRTYRRTGYLLDPHSAVGAIVARRMQEATRLPIVILATAHPAKFPETVEKAIGLKVPLPPSLQEAMARPKRSTRVSARFEEWKELLLRVSRRDAETQR